MWASLSARKVYSGAPWARSMLAASHTWLAQPRTLFASVRSASGSGGSVRPSSIR